MSNRKVHRIKLTDEERETFTEVAKGKRGKLNIAGWKVQRANAMLMCDEGKHGPAWPDHDISEAFDTTTRSLENWRKQAAEHGPLSLLERKQRTTPPTPAILDGEKEAQLTKIACSTPPDGRSRWTLQLLADELVRMKVVDSISTNTVGRVQKKRAEALVEVDVVHSS
jgi:transposase-like protein